MERAAAEEFESRDPSNRLARFDASLIATWLLGSGLTLLLALEGGGYDPVIRDQVGIVVWWIAIVGLLAGALPIRKPGMLPLTGIALLAGFALWTATSLVWTESVESTTNDLARVLTYLGVLVLAVMVRGSRGARQMATAIASSIALISMIALVSRLQPSLIPEATEATEILGGGRSRLAYPLNYWNGLAELMAIGLPLMLFVATSTRSRVFRAVAGGLMPAVGLALFLTFSRTGSIAALAGLVAFLAFSSDRVPKAVALLLTSAGAGLLIAVASGKEALEAGFAGPMASEQGDQLIVLVIVTCVAIGALHATFDWLLGERTRPRSLVFTREQVRGASLGLLACFLALVTFFVASGRAADGWSDFKQIESPGQTTVRLSSIAGNGRYQLWDTAAQQFASAPMTGTGSGTYEFWWARKGDIVSFVRDTHSLPLQTLGELGVPGFLLVTGFMGLVLVGGVRKALRAASDHRVQLAAALGGCSAFLLATLVDWPWQIAVLPVTFLLLASVLMTAGDRNIGASPSWAVRVAGAAAGILAIVGIALPLASTSAVRTSQSEARAGDLPAALESARTARRIQPSASTPHLQEALVLERLGDLPLASEAARAAAEREATNWRPWFVLARIEAKRGRVGKSIEALRESRELNPRSRLLDGS